MIICVLISVLCLMVFAFNILSKAYAEDPQETFETQFTAVTETKQRCEEVICRNETKLTWIRAMLAAFKLDEEKASCQLELARDAADKEDFSQAMIHLRKAANWYESYHKRLRAIYRLDQVPVPPIPVIDD
ncbi:MAG: hypothetical protein K2Y22_14730 [Candidatus Obscuribacterales bacterium]|nr:hypothetical protein [Candidatus Obscuribacterales bacterium]